MSDDDSAAFARDVRMATFRLSRRLRAQRAVDTVTDSQLAVLAALLYGGLRTLGELAESERITAPSMNRTVNCLEEAGYVTRTPDAEDRRRVLIELTDNGRRLMEETQRRRDAWLEDALGELSEGERTALMAAVPVMRKVAER